MPNWKPFYLELAAQLNKYEHRQGELLAFLTELRAAGRTITPLTDKDADGNTFPLEEIDPFTVFGVFNRGIKMEERTRIAEAYREYFSIEAPVPTDFTGVPVLHNLRSWFLRFTAKRGVDDVAKLWELFREAQQPNPFGNANFRAAFEAVLNLQGININITLGLYWVQPNAFVPLDVATRNRLGITTPRRVTPAYYADIVQRVAMNRRTI